MPKRPAPKRSAPEVMSPGTYLRMRREAAGLSLADVAKRLADLPCRIREITPDDIKALQARIATAEADRGNITVAYCALLRNVFAFDIEAYQQLLLKFYAPHLPGLPIPQLCRTCGCSWHDPCATAHGPCSWTEDPTLCTACAGGNAHERELATALADWPDAPAPEQAMTAQPGFDRGASL